MKLVKIQDKHIINKKFLPEWQQRLYDGNGCHTYVLYKDVNKHGNVQHKLLATSHYYDPDKVTRIKKKNAILMRFKDLKEPTTVTNVKYAKDIKGRQFSSNYTDMQVIGTLSPYQERKIRKFLSEGKIKSWRKKGKRDYH